MLELTRRAEGDFCRRCRTWFLRRTGFGLRQRWCTRLCWLASPQRRALHPPSARLFQCGRCSECDNPFTIRLAYADVAQDTGHRFCSGPCRRRHKRRQLRSNQVVRLCPGCLERNSGDGRGSTRTVGMLCSLCRKIAIYACLSKTRFADQEAARALPWKQRVYPCPLCDGWHCATASRKIRAGDEDVLRRLAPMYDQLALDPKVKTAVIYGWRLRRGAGI